MTRSHSFDRSCPPQHGVASKRGWLQLLVLSLSLALLWIIVLPWLAQRSATRRYLERLDARGIDPAAMYYTELPPEIFLDAGGRPRPQE